MVLNKQVASVILSVSIFGLTYGISAPLISLKLIAAGTSENIIGLNAAMQAAGVFLIAPFLPRLFRRYKAANLMIISLISIAVIFYLFTRTSYTSWYGLRLLLGLFSEIIMVQSETWLNSTTVEKARGKVLSLYTAGMSLGFATGPLLLSLTGSGNNDAFFLAGFIALISGCILFKTGLKQTTDHVKSDGNIYKSLKLAAIPVIATALNAAIEVIGLNFLTIYATRMGWDESSSTLLVSILMIGAVVLQPLIGWLSDKTERMALIQVLAYISAITAFIWPHVLSHHLVAYAVLFLWGGIFVGIYTVCITWVGQQFHGEQLTGVYSAMSVSWGVGALAGPLLGGVAMQNSLNGLPYLTGILCLCFATYSSLARKNL
ncbi:MFS transporter [Enterobacter bugandensis]